MGKFPGSTVITFTNRSIKILIGYFLDGKVYPFYSLDKEIPTGIISNGVILRPKELSQELTKLALIEDSAAKLKININDVYLGIPPIGLQVYNCNKSTNTISDDNKINETDLKNLRNLITKDKPDPNTVFVDIVPEKFILDNGISVTNSPIGMVSSTVTLSGKVFVLPKNIYDSYIDVFTNSPLKLKRAMIITPAIVQFLSNFPNIPRSYVLCDIGEDITHLSFVGDNKLFGSTSFALGGANITNKIMESFSCSFQEAEKIKKLYGYDTRSLSFEPIVYTLKNEDGSEKTFTLNDLNNIIRSELENFASSFNNALSILFAKYDPKFRQTPVIAIGGGSNLLGLEGFMNGKIESKSFNTIIPNNLGVRKRQYFSLLGLIEMAQTSKTGLTMSTIREKSISREETYEKN